MKYYKPIEIAKELGIPNTTLYRWIYKGILTPDKVSPSGRRLFSEDTVNSFRERLEGNEDEE